MHVELVTCSIGCRPQTLGQLVGLWQDALRNLDLPNRDEGRHEQRWVAEGFA